MAEIPEVFKKKKKATTSPRGLSISGLKKSLTLTLQSVSWSPPMLVSLFSFSSCLELTCTALEFDLSTKSMFTNSLFLFGSSESSSLLTLTFAALFSSSMLTWLLYAAFSVWLGDGFLSLEDSLYRIISSNSCLIARGSTQPRSQQRARSASSSRPRDNSHKGVSGTYQPNKITN